MELLIFMLLLLVAGLSIYLFILQRQIKKINQKLQNRITGMTKQPLTIELMNKELISLTANINKCLKAEENLRLNSVQENNHFKELIANISHDLRTPLTAVKGYQQLLTKENLSEEQQQKLQTAMKHADNLGALIEQFFEYSYLINAKEQPEPEKLNLTNLLTECLAEHYESFQAKDIAIFFEQEEPIYAFADRRMTTRIIHNLLRNCLHHSCGDVNVSMNRDTNAVFTFTNPIADSTIDIERIFERFYTADSSRSNTTGLGLSIVRLLTELQNGSAEGFLEEQIFSIKISLPLAAEVVL